MKYLSIKIDTNVQNFELQIDDDKKFLLTYDEFI